LDISAFTDLAKQIGWIPAMVTVVFFRAQYWIYKLYEGRLSDRQDQIDKLAAENHEYRDRFTTLMDRHFGYDGKKKE